MVRITKISAIITAYNHEKYIAECLDGAVAQVLNIPYEIYVGEDCSKDKTREIVLAYAAKYPHKIKPVLHKNNLGRGFANLMACLDHCDSEWIALIEGDDFWTDPHKLQKQVDLLEAHPDAVLSFSRAQSLDESGAGFAPGRIFGPPQGSKAVFDRYDLLAMNVIPTCTIVFKRSLLFPRLDWLFDWHLTDWLMSLHLLNSGTAVFVDQVTAMYRIHSGGKWSTKSPQVKFESQEKLIKFLIEKEQTRRGRRILHLHLFSQQMGLVISYLWSKQWTRSVAKLAVALKTATRADWTHWAIRIYLRRSFQLVKYFFRISRVSKENDPGA